MKKKNLLTNNCFLKVLWSLKCVKVEYSHRVILPSPPSSEVFRPDCAWAFSSWSFCFLFYVFFGFPVFALVFSYIASLCLFRVFFSFYTSVDLLHTYFATFRPLPSLFPHPHRIELPMHLSMYGICLHAIGVYFPIFLLFLCLK